MSLRNAFNICRVPGSTILKSNPVCLIQKRLKTGIVMLNMGGPHSTEHVHDFLLRLFSDREILQLPAQNILSRIIAKRRSPKIIKQYTEIGGGSPITHWTKLQGKFLVDYLDQNCPNTAPHKLYIGFRYVHPLLENAINQMEKDGIKRAVAFSQYPQFSCTTSGSSFNAIARHYSSTSGTFTGVEKIHSPTLGNNRSEIVWSFIDRWPVASPLVTALTEHVKDTLNAISDKVQREDTVLLFSAHSIPISVVNRGDPYPQEVAATVHAVMQQLDFKWPYRLVWQSKVGPAAWLGPSTAKTLHGLARLGYHHALLIPIAFTSDHIETLYEMDVEYCKEVAKEAGMISVHRSASLNGNPGFLTGLGELVSNHLRSGELCSRQYLLRCPMCTNPSCGATRDFILSGRQKLMEYTAERFPPVQQREKHQLSTCPAP